MGNLQNLAKYTFLMIVPLESAGRGRADGGGFGLLLRSYNLWEKQFPAI